MQLKRSQKDLKTKSTRTTDRFGAANPGMNPHEPIPKKNGEPRKNEKLTDPGAPLRMGKEGKCIRAELRIRPFSLSIDDPCDLGRWSDPISGQTKSCHPSDNDPPPAGSSALGLLRASRRSERLRWTSRCRSTLSCLCWSLNRDIDGSTCCRRKI